MENHIDSIHPEVDGLTHECLNFFPLFCILPLFLLYSLIALLFLVPNIPDTGVQGGLTLLLPNHIYLNELIYAN